MIPPGGRVLCLGGGGSFGDFLAALVYRLLKNGTVAVKDYFTHIDGISTGAINGACLAYQGPVVDFQLWLTLKTGQIYETKDPSGIPFNEITDLLFKQWNGILNDKPLIEMLEKYIVGLPTIPIRVGFKDMESGHTFMATAFPNGTFWLQDMATLDLYDYDNSWLPMFRKCVLASGSTEGGVDPALVLTKGGTWVQTGLPTPDTTLVGLDGGPGRLVPADYSLELIYPNNGQAECIIISLTDPIKPFSGARNAIGTDMRSIDMILDSQFNLTMKIAKMWPLVYPNVNVVIYQKPLPPPGVIEDPEKFDPEVSKVLTHQAMEAEPVFGKLLN